MALDLHEQLERVNAKTTMVLEKYALMQTRLIQARAEIARLHSELRAKEQELEALQLKVEYLTVSHAVTPGGDELQATKALIAELVREIDRCIADLND